MDAGSKMNPLLTLEYIQTEHENRYFDRKSAKIRVADLAPLISAFANADGGTIVIGISDKKRTLEGIDSVGEDRINEFINAPKDCCKPMPDYKEEILQIINTEGKADRLLLLHITGCPDRVIRTVNDATWLRIGDRTKEMLGENLRNLEYSKNARHFENELNQDATIMDLDQELLAEYQKKVNAEDISVQQLLRARGFARNHNGKEYLTNGAVLLFAENIRQFYPNCRVRFLRYDGTFAGVGTHINIIQDVNIEYPILRILDKARNYIRTQLRNFTMLNVQTGRFDVVPEYPEFAWVEGIVNAVTHRRYDMSGSFIKVSMYDDRLEIESPGRFPDVVTVENIKETRFSRNPAISRVLTEFGWVRELNEGVKRIYSDMEDFFLDPPVYTETDQSVRLVLKNNIVMRSMRQGNRTVANVGEDIWEKLDELEKKILTYMTNRGAVRRHVIEEYTEKSSKTITTRLNHMMELGIVKANGSKYDPNRTYEACNLVK